MSGHLSLAGGAEFDAIRELLAVWGDAATGIGDDAASLAVPLGQRLLVSTDAAVEDVHFRRAWLTPREIGARACAAALSDLAAMGATPLGLVLALGLPASWRDALGEIARGVGEVARAARTPIVGGNITNAAVLSLTPTVLGTTDRTLRRDRARAGDRVYVTGQLGGPVRALRAWLSGAQPSPAARARFAAPTARVAEGQWLARHGATAAIDISDGLAADAAHLARASRATVALESGRIPRLAEASVDDAIHGGEEYELLVTAPAGALDEAEFAARFGIPLTPIGDVRSAPPASVLVDGHVVDRPRGHDHLS